jgi:O-antigen/teichoic acid export membrane protein
MKLPGYIISFLHISSEEDKNRLYKVLLPTFVIQVAGTGLSFLVSLLMGRSMGPTNYGIYIYCFSIVNGIVSFMVYGLNILSLRETSSLNAMEKPGIWKGFMLWSTSSLIILSVGGSMLAAIVFYFLPVLPNPALHSYVFIPSLVFICSKGHA